jgi:putative nucleotidyltransferase with HDIG domain
VPIADTLNAAQGAEANAVGGAEPDILLVEDQEQIRELIAAMLTTRGLAFDTASCIADARELMAKKHYDLLLVDEGLPDGSGLSLVQGESPGSPLVVVITAARDFQTAVRALRNGAIDFITKPFSVGDLIRRVDTAVEKWKSRQQLQEQARTLETLVKNRADELSRSVLEIDEVHDSTVLALGAALNLKDHETAEHCSRVSENAAALGRILSLSEPELQNLRWGSYLHDVGKIGIPEQILLKQGPLTAEERAIMEKHPLMGHELLRNIDFLATASDVVLSHHERYDGTGYPHRVRGTRIPLHARIFSIMDTLDAMTSDRPYHLASPISTALGEIDSRAGSQFDPEIVRSFLSAPQSTWRIQR